MTPSEPTTQSAPESSPVPSPAQPPEPGFLAMVTSVFHEPSVVGDSVERRGVDGRVLLAIVLILVVVAACAVVTMPQAQETWLEQMRSNPELKGDALAQAERFMSGTLGKVIIVGLGVIFGLLSIPVVALALHLGQLLMGGRATFGRVFALTAFASLISSGLGSVVRSILVLAKDSFTEVSTGLGVIALDRPITDPVRIGLDSIDFFILWATWSAGVALVGPSKLKKGTALAVSFAVYVLLIGAMTALRFVGAAMS